MKKLLSIFLVAVLAICSFSMLTACNNGETPSGNNVPQATPTPTPQPDIDPATVDKITDTWVATELSFETTQEYKNDSKKGALQFYVLMDVVFTNKNTGTTITMPAFWYEENTFKVRFAPTEYGVWEYKTVCETDPDLNGKTGTIGANEYKGDLDIYKHGFVTVQEGKKYFTYADGTPFFYLGDTHWNMLTEEFDQAGSHAGDIQTDSHFKYIVDKRVEQGFTVYQSEPIGHTYTVNDCKISKSDATGLAKSDKYFEYIAQKGLVHANAQFVFGNAISQQFAKNLEFMELTCRMWIARYAAYPVMWTLGQEIDNDMYYERGADGGAWFSYANNPWVNVAEFLHKYDPYNHPLSGHQENTGATTVTGMGANVIKASGGGKSVFADKDVTERTGHNWWAAQWSPSLTDKNINNAAVSKDYWATSKVSVNYEGRYCYLWTKDYGARAQGWFAYLNGFFGYGYGAIDIWLYKSTYNIDQDSKDGIETITKEDKLIPWSTAINFPSATHVGYMKHFFSFIKWWELVPDFFDENYFVGAKKTTNYACATIGNDLYVIYLCNKGDLVTGTVCGMDGDATYNAMWFNPRTCEYITIDKELKPNSADKHGKPAFELPNKPNNDSEDWVVLLAKNG